MGHRVENKNWKRDLVWVMLAIILGYSTLNKSCSPQVIKEEPIQEQIIIDSPTIQPSGSHERYMASESEDSDEPYYSGDENSDFDVELGTGDPDAEEIADFERD